MTGVVSNTSPLIVLAKAGLLELLPKIFTTVTISKAVHAEILAGPNDDPMKGAMSGARWLKIVALDPPLSPLAAIQLGIGEAEAIELARRMSSTVLLDDRAGRRAARSLGLHVVGTLSVIALAIQGGHLRSFEDAVGRLRSVGLYLSDSVINAVRQNLASGA